MQETNTEF